MEQDFSDVRIRAATNLDVESVKRLVFATLREYGLQPDPESTDADLSDIEESYFKRGGMFEVIEDAEGRLLGTAGIYPLDAETCELRKMYFAQKLRGRGLGRHMLERMLNNARRLGFKRMRLETASVLEAAIRLYTRSGFKPIETTHKSARCDQTYSLDL